MRKGTDLVTLDMLEELGACEDGRIFFAANHPWGTTYQNALDTACEHGRANFAAWLLDKLGPTDDIWEADKLKLSQSTVFPGSINVNHWIEVNGGLAAGGNIFAGDWIIVHGALHAGRNIQANIMLQVDDDISAEDIVVNGHIYGMGSITASGCIKADGHLVALGYIRVHQSIQVGKAIASGSWISADTISCGTGYGTYPGLLMPLDAKDNRSVRANSGPNNQMCGNHTEKKGW